MTNGQAEADRSAKGLPEDDRGLDPQDLAEPEHVLDPRVQVPVVGRALVAPSLAAVIEKDQLRAVCERSEEGLERAVVEAWAAMQADDGRSLPHRRPVGDKPHSFDVEVEPHVSDAYVHTATLVPLAFDDRSGPYCA